jgi:hypothetical protein
VIVGIGSFHRDGGDKGGAGEEEEEDWFEHGER